MIMATVLNLRMTAKQAVLLHEGEIVSSEDRVGVLYAAKQGSINCGYLEFKRDGKTLYKALFVDDVVTVIRWA